MRPLLAFAAAAFFAACGESDEPEVTQNPLSAERSITDQTDDATGPQLHLVYALPADGVDRQLDQDGTIATSIAAAQEWLRVETSGRTLRLDTFQGQPDISFFQLPQLDEAIQAEKAFARELIESEIGKKGLDDPDKLYLVYYDGGSIYACGSGAWPPVIEGNTAVLYLRGLPLDGVIRCGDNSFARDVESPGFWEYVAVHEILHTLGFVATCAPNETLHGHISGPADDLMYEGEEQSDGPKALDAGRDDYFDAGIPGCPDFSDSPYLTP